MRALLLLLALIVVVENWVPLPTSPSLSQQGESLHFWVNKTFAPAQYEVILVGDSRLYRGLSPAQIQPYLPCQKILNFGYSSGGLNEEMFAIAAAKLTPKGRHRAVVLGVTPHSLSGNGRKNEAIKKYMNISPLLRIRLAAPQAVGGADLLQMFQPTSVSMVRQSLRNWILNHTPSRYIQTYHIASGWVASQMDPPAPESALASYAEAFRKTSVDPRSIDETINAVKQWQNSGIQVFGFRPPSSEKMVELENRLSSFDEQAFVTAFERAGGVWIHLPVPTSYMSYDGSHLDKASAQVLSQEIARTMGPYFSCPTKLENK